MIILVLLLIIYLVGTATGFVPKMCEGKPANDCKQIYMSSGSSGWEKTLGKFMSRFAPRLPVKQLLGNRVFNTCRVVTFNGSTAILLDSTFRQCNITVDKFTGDYFRVGRFSMAESRGRVYVTYKQTGKAEFTNKIVLPDDPQDISVMPAGGNITLSCGACSAGALHVTIK